MGCSVDADRGRPRDLPEADRVLPRPPSRSCGRNLAKGATLAVAIGVGDGDGPLAAALGSSPVHRPARAVGGSRPFATR
jgi:hypothetical protein